MDNVLPLVGIVGRAFGAVAVVATIVVVTGTEFFEVKTTLADVMGIPVTPVTVPSGVDLAIWKLGNGGALAILVAVFMFVTETRY